MSSPGMGPTPVARPLGLLLHHCLLHQPDLLLPSDLRATLLSLQEAPEAQGPLFEVLASALCICSEPCVLSLQVFQLFTTFKELMQSVKFRLHVQEPFFSQLKNGSKTIEGRCAIGAYNSFLPGDLLLFNDFLTLVVKAVNHHKSFEEMLTVEGLDRVLPGVTSIADGVAVYRRFYSEEKERLGGAVAIHVQHDLDERQPLLVAKLLLVEGCIQLNF